LKYILTYLFISFRQMIPNDTSVATSFNYDLLQRTGKI
jgi:hypothetical protein